MTYLKLLKVLLPCLIGALLAGGAVWKIQQVRVDSRNAALKQAETDLVSCRDANTTNQGTIAQLKNEIGTLQTTCSKRITTKETVINRCREIDNLQPIIKETVDSAQNNADKAVPGGVSDPLLDHLNRMWGDSAADNKN